MFKIVEILDADDWKYGKIVGEDYDEEGNKMFKIQLLNSNFTDKIVGGDVMTENHYAENLKTVGHGK